MAGQDAILGFSFSGDTVQVVEIVYGEPRSTIHAMDEFANVFSNKDYSNQDVENFSTSISRFMKAFGVKSREASVALDSGTLFMNTIPMDTDLSQSEVNEHINWELTQFFPEQSPRSFINDIHVLNESAQENIREVLTVSVLRAQADAIQKALSRIGISLNIVDVDHFSAETALRVNYPDTTTKYLGLVGVKRNRLDVSLLRKGVLESYSYYAVESNQDIVERIGILSREIKGIYSIVAYGPHLEKDLLAQIRRGSSMLVEALNPLRHVEVSETLNLAENLTVPSYRFASAVGVALRRD